MELAEMSRLCRLVRSENISGWRDEIWFSDRFNTIRLPSPLKDFLERQESQSACKELADKSISTSLVRGWKSRDERTDSLLFSSLSWLSSGTLSKRLAGRATISLPDSESWLSVVITPLQVRGVYFNIYNYPRDPEFWGHRGRWELHHGPGRSDCCWVGAAWGWRRSWRRPLPPAWDRWRRGPVWPETSVCSCLPCQSRGRWRPWGCCVTCWERSSSALNTVHRLAVATRRCGRARDCWGEAALPGCLPPQTETPGALAGGRSGRWGCPVSAGRPGCQWGGGRACSTWWWGPAVRAGGGNFRCAAVTCDSPARRSGWRGTPCLGRESRRSLSDQTPNLSS